MRAAAEAFLADAGWESPASKALGESIANAAGAFFKRSAKYLRNLFLAATLTMVGPGQLARSEVEALDREYGVQMEYLRGFETATHAGSQALDGTLAARAEQYGASAWGVAQKVAREGAKSGGVFDQERRILGPVATEHCSVCLEYAERGWMPIGTAPAIGDSPCMIRCACFFVYRNGDGGDEYLAGRGVLHDPVFGVTAKALNGHLKYNPNHDQRGRFSSGSRGGGGGGGGHTTSEPQKVRSDEHGALVAGQREERTAEAADIRADRADQGKTHAQEARDLDREHRADLKDHDREQAGETREFLRDQKHEARDHEREQARDQKEHARDHPDPMSPAHAEFHADQARARDDFHQDQKDALEGHHESQAESRASFLSDQADARSDLRDTHKEQRQELRTGHRDQIADLIAEHRQQQADLLRGSREDR